jgi:dienelactone hydrolase
VTAREIARAWPALGVALGLAACGLALLPSDSAKIPEYVGANGVFSKPAAPAPFPTVVIMHGCGGASDHRAWIGRLNEWGYATYYIDSFTPRRLKHVCADRQLTGSERVDDAYAALAYLRTRSDVRADRIGLIGFSHGAAAASYTVRAENAARADTPPFSAAVAYYGGCTGDKVHLATDLLILFGEADDWGNVKACRRMVERQDKATKGRLTIVTYPGAYHSFDNGPRPPREFLGHHLEYNEAAATDSFARARAFFDQRLKN